MWQLIGDVLERLAQAGKRTRDRSAQAQLRYEEAVRALVCNLVHRRAQAPEGRLMVPLAKAALTPKVRPAPFMTEGFADTVKALASPGAGIVDLELGRKTLLGGVQTTIAPAPWLRECIEQLGLGFSDIAHDPSRLGDPLVLRSTKVKGVARSLPLPDTAGVRQLRAEMHMVNEWLARADVEWTGTDDGVDPGQRCLKRIFNNGSLSLGGRLYHGFWQHQRKDGRLQSLRIGGQPVASLDFAQMGVRLAYGLIRMQPPDGDLYQVLGVGNSRQGVKQVLNALLSADQPLGRFPAGTRQCFPRRVKFTDVVEAIARRHPALVPLFGSAQALHFQYLESQVTLRSLLALKELGIVALPVHDCLLVGLPAVQSAKEVLESSFREVCGVEGKVEIESLYPLGKA